jgi:hypothetical protein
MIRSSKRQRCCDCIFCIDDVFLCAAADNRPIFLTEYYTVPSWCPFRYEVAAKSLNGWRCPF